MQSIEHEYSKAFGPGMIVDLDEPVAEDLTLGDLLRNKDGQLPPGLFEAFQEEPIEQQPAIAELGAGEET